MTVYLDTSDLLKLFVEQEGFEAVRKLVHEASDLETSVVAYPEARSAFGRLKREGRLSAADLARTRDDFERAWATYNVQEISEALACEAGELAARYRLRGCDSLHLACYARIVQAIAPVEVRFSSSDVRLLRAAQALASRLAGARPPWLEGARASRLEEAGARN